MEKREENKEEPSSAHPVSLSELNAPPGQTAFSPPNLRKRKRSPPVGDDGDDKPSVGAEDDTATPPAAKKKLEVPSSILLQTKAAPVLATDKPPRAPPKTGGGAKANKSSSTSSSRAGKNSPSKQHSSPKEPPSPLRPTFQYHPAGVHASDMRLRKKRELDNIPVVPLPPHVLGGLRDQIDKSKVCNCRRSNCLKLYCDCFQASLHCNSLCNCVSCKNNPQYPIARTNAVEATLYRNSHSFRPRVTAMAAAVQEAHSSPFASPIKKMMADFPFAPNLSSTPTKMGCNCKKSHCLKLYCECLQASIYCSARCRCLKCQNKKGNPDRERVMAKRRKQKEEKAQVAMAVGEHSRRMGRMAMMESRVSTTGGGAGNATPSKAGGATATNVSSSQEMPQVEATAALAADAALHGIDVFLPPSSFVIPMRLPDSGAPWGALGFGMTDPKQLGLGGLPTPPSNKRSRVSPPKPRPMRWRQPPGRETELEKAWREETELVGRTFDAVRTKLKELGTEGLLPPRTTIHAPMVDFRAEHTVRVVTQDFPRLAAAVKHGEETARQFLAQQEDVEAMDVDDDGEDSGPAGPKQGHECVDKDEADVADESFQTAQSETSPVPEADVSALLCDEDIAERTTSGQPMSKFALEQLTVLCAQDTALLRELARIIRQKTMELTKRRVQLVKDEMMRPRFHQH